MDFTTISHEGRNVRVATVGSGTPVVLLHGFPDGPRSWQATADALVAAGHRAIVPYLRGYHPDTIAEGRSYGRAEIGADVVHLMDALGVEQAVLVGHDWGAACVWSAVSQAPDRVIGIVPIAIPHPATMTPSPRLAWAVRHFFNLKAPLSDRRTARNDFRYIETLYQRWAPSWRGAARGAAVALAKEILADERVRHEVLQWYRDLSLRPDAAHDYRVACPGLVVVGGDDFDGDLEPYRRTLRRFDAPAELLVVDGAGHWPHREGQLEFDQRLVAFLGSLPAA